jgi:hypothetical protein
VQYAATCIHALNAGISHCVVIGLTCLFVLLLLLLLQTSSSHHLTKPAAATMQHQQ